MIKIEELRKIYKNGKMDLEVLKGINIHIKEGEFVAIMGPSGSGKSTLMNILGCLDRASLGKYYLDEKEVSLMNEKELSKYRNLKIGFVFQSFNLISRTSAISNVELPMLYAGFRKKVRRERAEMLLEKVGLKERMHHQPNELSGGQRQRVAIARSLANNPAIILADEPTGNLDTKSGDEIMALFKELNEEGKTIVLVTHEPEIAEKCKRIIVVRDGLVVEDKNVL